MSRVLPIFVNVNPGQTNPNMSVSQNGNEVDIVLNSMLSLPEGAKNPRLSLKRASFFFNFPNLLNDDFIQFEYGEEGKEAPLFGADGKIMIDQGLYDVKVLNSTITLSLTSHLTEINTNLGTSFASGIDIINLIPNYATNKIVLHHGFAGYLHDGGRIVITLSPRMRQRLGFEAIELNDSSPDHISGSSDAKFNTVNNILVYTSLLGAGSGSTVFNGDVNKRYLDIIPITVKPSKQQVFNQLLDQDIPLGSLDNVSTFKVAMYDEQGNNVIMISNWSALMTVKYDI